MIEYPREYLPLPLREGYAFQAVSPMQRTEMQSGRARQRRRFTSVPTMAAVSWILTDNQALIFESWFEDALNSGSEWFECPLKTPEGIHDYVARFTDIYQGPALVGISHWRFTAQLELRERPILAPGWGNFPGLIAGSSLIDLALNREWPEFHFNYATYAEALADLGNLTTGDVVTVRADETQSGASSSYEAYVAPPSTLILDFTNNAYYVYDKTSTLTLVNTWAQ